MSAGEYIAYYAKVVSLLVGWTFVAAIVVSTAEKFFDKRQS